MQFSPEANVSDTGQSYIVVNSLTDDDGQLSTVIDLFHLPESMGMSGKPVAYLVYGLPGTNQFAFMDLNKLPDNLRVVVEVLQDDQCMSRSEFVGKLGNSQQPV